MERYALTVLFVILFALQGQCQENQISDDQNASQISGEAAKVQEISIYGEIKSVNSANNSIVVQYYDYDSDTEKSVEITTDHNTKMEGAVTINDIKQNNWADINYAVVNGKNIAKSIAVEKEEDAAAEAPAS